MEKKYREQIKELSERLEAVAEEYRDAKLSGAQYAAVDQLLAGVGTIIEGLDNVISGASTNEGGHDEPEPEPESAEKNYDAHQKLVIDAFDMANNSAAPFGVLLMGIAAAAMVAVFVIIAIA